MSETIRLIADEIVEDGGKLYVANAATGTRRELFFGSGGRRLGPAEAVPGRLAANVRPVRADADPLTHSTESARASVASGDPTARRHAEAAVTAAVSGDHAEAESAHRLAADAHDRAAAASEGLTAEAGGGPKVTRMHLQSAAMHRKAGDAHALAEMVRGATDTTEATTMNAADVQRLNDFAAYVRNHGAAKDDSDNILPVSDFGFGDSTPARQTPSPARPVANVRRDETDNVLPVFNLFPGGEEPEPVVNGDAEGGDCDILARPFQWPGERGQR